ncbi:hypothetical protein BCR34DRAFT_601542 [Clohesyomyces aquaticus]|uniref:DUF6594 domain-containing protein n=1 Tax=Clohesyomyces aquaticus TaxID=1231657 RepID=A0A1Y1ZM53_9PLEO|nr:hypothetical protein BCR34DRAFT_601542 [Clohesyomyces aquaticus]
MPPKIEPAASSDANEIKRSDFGSKDAASTTATDSPNTTEGDNNSIKNPDPDGVKSKVGSKISIETSGPSTLKASEALVSHASSHKSQLKKSYYTPPPENKFLLASTFSLTDSGGSSMDFRRFERANARRLLTLEAEIADLDDRLEQMEWKRMGSEDIEKTRRHQEKEEGLKELSALLDVKLDRYYDALLKAKNLSGAFEQTKKKGIFVRSLSAIFTLFFLVIAIVVLYFITKPVARVGALSGFTTAFAIVLISFTNAKRHEVFVGTAAYAAVLVVFVSGNLANTNYYNAYYPNGVEPANLAPIQTMTQTVTLGGGELLTATATVTATQVAVTSIYPTTCTSSTLCATTSSPTGKSAAPKRGSQKMPFGAQFVVCFLLAVLGIL